eukprot:TRINITY_DN3528_c0_g1_i2.p1 TRINITY_DN3528_c0_g1~~TRINITY_DN3528_c0_g1_i2.p1  ORF type:complete len:532 (-),score=144.71 TRINITY_DN3528_c0_g1_i2:201-1796(-)
MATPYLPGFVDNRSQARAKSQNFVFLSQAKETVQHEKYAPEYYEEPLNMADQFKTTAADIGLHDESAPHEVLRFYGYFIEAVTESPDEAVRVRKCVILYYLTDGTMQILEPKQTNSGIPQGTFVKRHALPKPNGDFYDYGDLSFGVEISIYGRTFRIVDCDKATERYYIEQGMELGSPEGYPEDQYMNIRDGSIDHREFKGKRMNPLKKFMESDLGKVISSSQSNFKQFLDNDRKVLRFYCSWDDRKALYGDVNQYTLNFFLADNTVAVAEVHTANNGRDPFPAMLKRQKLVKNWKRDMFDDSERGVEGTLPKEAYVLESDFRIGKTVNVFGRPLLLKSCDDFTRDYYQRMGNPQPADLIEEKPETKEYVHSYPPHTGFGTPEDSLASCKSLVAKPPRVDFKKFMENDKKVLRFQAKLITKDPQDADRIFMIQYFLADDSLSVFEPPQRNSGIVSGTFLARSRYRNTNDAYFVVEDFLPGKDVTVSKRRFHVYNCDNFTKKQLANMNIACPACEEIRVAEHFSIQGHQPLW